MLVAGCYFTWFVLCLMLFIVCLFRGMETRHKEGSLSKEILACVSDPVCQVNVYEVLKMERAMRLERSYTGFLG